MPGYLAYTGIPRTDAIITGAPRDQRVAWTTGDRCPKTRPNSRRLRRSGALRWSLICTARPLGRVGGPLGRVGARVAGAEGSNPSVGFKQREEDARRPGSNPLQSSIGLGGATPPTRRSRAGLRPLSSRDLCSTTSALTSFGPLGTLVGTAAVFPWLPDRIGFSAGCGLRERGSRSQTARLTRRASTAAVAHGSDWKDG
jgi:hypothetical protein